MCSACVYRMAVKWLFLVQSYVEGWNLSHCGSCGDCSYHDQVISIGGSGVLGCGMWHALFVMVPLVMAGHWIHTSRLIRRLRARAWSLPSQPPVLRIFRMSVSSGGLHRREWYWECLSISRIVPRRRVSAPGRGCGSLGEDFHPATQRATELRRHDPSPRVHANCMDCRVLVGHVGK